MPNAPSLLWLNPRDSFEQCWAGQSMCRERFFLAPTCWEHLAVLHAGDLLPHGSVLAVRAGTTMAASWPTPPPDPAAGMLSRTPLPGLGHVAPSLHGLLVRAILLLLVAIARLHLASLLVGQLGLGEAVVKAGVLGQASAKLGRLQGLEGQAGCAAGAVDGAGSAHGVVGQACKREAGQWACCSRHLGCGTSIMQGGIRADTCEQNPEARLPGAAKEPQKRPQALHRQSHLCTLRKSSAMPERWSQT